MENYKNPLIGYLNINSLRNKVLDLGIIMQELQLDYFVISETKLNESFPTSQFQIDGYDIRAGKIEISLVGVY